MSFIQTIQALFHPPFDRRQGLGGSDLPAALGFLPWRSPLEVYWEKTGASEQSEEKEEKVQALLKIGHLLEPYVISHLEQEKNLVITRKQARLFHPEHDFLYGTLDGFLPDSEEVLEIKTSQERLWREGIPNYVLVQAAYYVHLTDAAGAKIVVLFRESGKLEEYSYSRDRDFEQALLQGAVRFWRDHIESRRPPQPTSYKELQALFPQAKEVKKIASEEMKECLQEMKVLEEEQKRIKAQIEFKKSSVCEYLQEASTLIDEENQILATWKTRASHRFDSTTFKVEHPEVYSHFLKASESRYFQLK